MSKADKGLPREGHYETMSHRKSFGQERYVGSTADDTNDVTASGYQINSEVKRVDENEQETTNILKFLVSDPFDNSMKTCANKFIRRTKSVVANHKDQVEVRLLHHQEKFHLKPILC